MQVTKITVQNFRSLENAEIALDNQVTLVVGRNNSGKTSLTEVFYKFLYSDSPRFSFDDFSLKAHAKFRKSLDLWQQLKVVATEKDDEKIKAKEAEFRASIPGIVAQVYIGYDEGDNLAALAPFIMDLDPARKDALISFEYTVNKPEQFFIDFDKGKEKDLITFIKKGYKSYYSSKVFAIDAALPIHRKQIESRSLITALFLSDFIYAQRHIDDKAASRSEKLAKGFEEYYNNHHKDPAHNEQFQTALDETSAKWDEIYKIIFEGLIKDLQGFGYPGLHSHELEVKSKFDVEKVLHGHTNIFYNHEQNLLPETYNGLGFKNLIYIILQLISFLQKYLAADPKPSFHLLFIEEPEAHLHPQMQCSFIRNIEDYLVSKSWNVQIIITTHSSHILSEKGFSTIRYFDNSGGSVAVKSLRKFEDEGDEVTVRFLKQYMSLSNCDMFFADKLILTEGTVERLLLPIMIKKLPKPNAAATPKGKQPIPLSAQYVSTIEVGGAYAFKFKKIVDFLGVKTLVIADLDTVQLNANKRWEKCPVTAGVNTSNQTLKEWLPKKLKKDDLFKCKPADKIENNVKVTYQTLQKGETTCGRSFEEDFIMLNAASLAAAKEISNEDLFKGKTAAAIKAEAYNLAEALSSKTDFAYDILQLSDWASPQYIVEGLGWLESD